MRITNGKQSCFHREKQVARVVLGMSWKTISHCLKRSVSVSFCGFGFGVFFIISKNTVNSVKEFHSTKAPRHGPDNGRSKRALQNRLSVSTARMKPAMIRLLNNQANSSYCNKRCLWGWSKHRQVWFTCLSKRKNTCNKEPCKLSN